MGLQIPANVPTMGTPGTTYKITRTGAEVPSSNPIAGTPIPQAEGQEQPNAANNQDIEQNAGE